MVRFSAAIDHWPGFTPAVPRPPDWLAWPARNPSAVARPELDACTDPKVKKRAITGQLKAASARTSRPSRSDSTPSEVPAIPKPTAKTSAITGLRMISWAVADAPRTHHAFVASLACPAAAIGDVATSTAMAAFLSSSSNHSTITSAMPIRAKTSSSEPPRMAWPGSPVTSAQFTIVPSRSASACWEPNDWFTTSRVISSDACREAVATAAVSSHASSALPTPVTAWAMPLPSWVHAVRMTPAKTSSAATVAAMAKEIP
jgi:hypothetical protein